MMEVLHACIYGIYASVTSTQLTFPFPVPFLAAGHAGRAAAGTRAAASRPAEACRRDGHSLVQVCGNWHHVCSGGNCRHLGHVPLAVWQDVFLLFSCSTISHFVAPGPAIGTGAKAGARRAGPPWQRLALRLVSVARELHGKTLTPSWGRTLTWYIVCVRKGQQVGRLPCRT